MSTQSAETTSFLSCETSEGSCLVPVSNAPRASGVSGRTGGWSTTAAFSIIDNRRLASGETFVSSKPSIPPL